MPTMPVIFFCLIGLLLTTAAASRELRSAIPSAADWTRVGVPPEGHPASFTLILRGEHHHELEGRMNDVAASRGKWLTSSELDYYAAPSADAHVAVQAFLDQHGVQSSEITFSRAKNVVSVQTTTRKVAKMFSTAPALYKDTVTSQVHVKATRLVVPSELAPHITNIEGLTTFAKPSRANTRRPARPSEDMASTPSGPSPVHTAPPGCVDRNASWPCVRQFYGVDTYTPPAGSESVAVIVYATWLDQTILDFERNLVPGANGYIPIKRTLGSGPDRWDSPTEGGEDTLDIEALIGMAYPLDLITYASTVSFADSIRALIELPDDERPGVASLSYGAQEDDNSPEDAVAMCDAVQQLTALGTTFITGSADHGVAAFRPDMACPPFGVAWLSSCPYVVVVGATMKMSEERAAFWDDRPEEANGWSGGGFSNRLMPMSYQQAAIQTYLTQTELAESGYFNAAGRGYSDISAMGHELNAWFADGFAFVGGVSASSPISASIFALVNSKCKAAGKPRVGWIHPTIYSHPEAFNDITKGGSYACNTTKLGLPCAPGWDPATGLGSPSFPALVKAFGCD